MEQPASAREVRWEHLTGPDVAALAKATNVAVIPVGCTEIHGPHLPTGCDAFHSLAVCERAARLELAVVLPPIFYNINDQMQCYPGVIHISQETMTRFYHDLCLECARNGFDHIIFGVGHGGSETPIERLMGDALETRTRTGRWPYIAVRAFLPELMREASQQEFPGVSDGHGGPVETSLILAVRPELVHLERVTEPGPVHKRRIPHIRPRVPWDRPVPLAMTGDPRPAEALKGDIMLAAAARRLAEVIAQFRRFDPEKDF